MFAFCFISSFLPCILNQCKSYAKIQYPASHLCVAERRDILLKRRKVDNEKMKTHLILVLRWLVSTRRRDTIVFVAARQITAICTNRQVFANKETQEQVDELLSCQVDCDSKLNKADSIQPDSRTGQMKSPSRPWIDCSNIDPINYLQTLLQ